MDKIFIEHLVVATIIGVHDWEREAKQDVIIDLELGVDARAAASSDKLDDALDYAAVAEKVTALAESARYQLIETLAERIAAMILKKFAVSNVKIELTKPGAIENADSVGVVIERQL